MDKISGYVNQGLFDVFGLCPDYTVLWTDKEWLEFRISQPFYYGKLKVDPYLPTHPETVRLHLREHKVRMDNGLHITASFAVYHPTKTIYVRVTEVGGIESHYVVSNG